MLSPSTLDDWEHYHSFQESSGWDGTRLPAQPTPSRPQDSPSSTIPFPSLPLAEHHPSPAAFPLSLHKISFPGSSLTPVATLLWEFPWICPSPDCPWHLSVLMLSPALPCPVHLSHSQGRKSSTHQRGGRGNRVQTLCIFPAISRRSSSHTAFAFPESSLTTGLENDFLSSAKPHLGPSFSSN